MKLKFDANLTYQLDAVKAVVDLFEGQPLSQSDFEISFTSTEPRQEYALIAPTGTPDHSEATDEEKDKYGFIGHTKIAPSSQADWVEDIQLGIGNRLILDNDALLTNVHTIQERNDIDKTPTLQGNHFSVEMETGTGKTYVYLRSIFELK